MSNYYHDTNLNKCDALCGNCKYGVECDISLFVRCTEHEEYLDRTDIKFTCNKFMKAFLWICKHIFKFQLEMDIYKLKTQYCSEHEFREDK